ncbi:MAG: ATP-binding cassette domain-containing protein, partial [Candidatus Thorarchaeota archaeon]|nr:ATP-binding cassette domain-containing protein [Candidatus Thorarchaeota archaeon]
MIKQRVKTMAGNGTVIKTTALAKNFDSVHAVRNLDLEVATGGRFGFLGPNGAGKTTTVRILSGLMKQTSGEAEVVGYNIATHRNEVKAITGLLPESPGLYSKLSAVEFLEFIGALNDRNGESLNRRIDILLGMLGLEG